jgi:ParB family transcriptional regulator, chromosome partitioning protein
MLIEIERLKPFPLNPRGALGETIELEQSINAYGTLQSLVVRPVGDAFEVVAGGRRLLALKRLARRGEVKEVDCLVRDLTDEAAIEIALIENMQRVDLNPIEEGRALLLLYDRQPEVERDKFTLRIARGIGRTIRFVQERMQLARDLPTEAQTSLALGKISLDTAREILRAPESMRATILARTVPITHERHRDPAPVGFTVTLALTEAEKRAVAEAAEDVSLTAPQWVARVVRKALKEDR